MSSYSENTKRRYDERLIKFGYNPKTLGWLKGRQGVRFSALTSIGNVNQSRILDIGCGFGDLYGFLQFKKLKFEYLGLELNPNLIEHGKKRYPSAKFRLFDIEKDELPKNFDWIIISGLFNYKRKNPYCFVQSVLKRAFNACKSGVAADFMTSYVDYRNKNGNYSSPERIFKIGRGVTNRITIRHDYMPFEFCLYLYKNQKITKNFVFSVFYKSLEPSLKTNKWLQIEKFQNKISYKS